MAFALTSFSTKKSGNHSFSSTSSSKLHHQQRYSSTSTNTTLKPSSKMMYQHKRYLPRFFGDEQCMPTLKESQLQAYCDLVISCTSTDQEKKLLKANIQTLHQNHPHHKFNILLEIQGQEKPLVDDLKKWIDSHYNEFISRYNQIKLLEDPESIEVEVNIQKNPKNQPILGIKPSPTNYTSYSKVRNFVLPPPVPFPNNKSTNRDLDRDCDDIVPPVDDKIDGVFVTPSKTLALELGKTCGEIPRVLGKVACDGIVILEVNRIPVRSQEELEHVWIKELQENNITVTGDLVPFKFLVHRHVDISHIQRDRIIGIRRRGKGRRNSYETHQSKWSQLEKQHNDEHGQGITSKISVENPINNVDVHVDNKKEEPSLSNNVMTHETKVSDMNQNHHIIEKQGVMMQPMSVVVNNTIVNMKQKAASNTSNQAKDFKTKTIASKTKKASVGVRSIIKMKENDMKKSSLYDVPIPKKKQAKPIIYKKLHQRDNTMNGKRVGSWNCSHSSNSQSSQLSRNNRKRNNIDDQDSYSRFGSTNYANCSSSSSSSSMATKRIKTKNISSSSSSQSFAVKNAHSAYSTNHRNFSKNQKKSSN